ERDERETISRRGGDAAGRLGRVARDEEIKSFVERGFVRRLEAGVVEDGAGNFIERGDEVVAFYNNVAIGRVGVALLPVIIFDGEGVVVAAILAVVIVVVTAPPIIMIGVEHDIATHGNHGRAIVGVDFMAGAELVVDDVAGYFFAVGEALSG